MGLEGRKEGEEIQLRFSCEGAREKGGGGSEKRTTPRRDPHGRGDVEDGNGVEGGVIWSRQTAVKARAVRQWP